MFGPDLDIYSVQYKRWGLLRWLWRPYQKWICHRSWLSHGFLVGTGVRIIYLSSSLAFMGAGILAIAPFLGLETEAIESHFASLWQQRSQYAQEATALFAGLELGAMSHSLSDGLGTFFRKIAPKKSASRFKK
jgi:uncharacterized metal-binding protein